jgi:GTP cyclohydrolase II
MSFSFGFGGGKSKAKTGPWARQAPFLTQGFDWAQNLYNQQQSSPWASTLGQYGQMLAPNIGQANQFFGSVMDGSFQNQFDSMRENYWRPENQVAADALRSDTIEGLRRSDWGDALGASISGLGVGQGSDGYLKMRLASEENALRGYQQQLAGMHGQAADRQYQAASDWAGRSFGGANMMANMGMQGLDLLHQQNQAPWETLNNYWNIIAGNSWGGKENKSNANFNMGFG